MAYSPVASHDTMVDASLDDHLGVPQTGSETLLPAYVNNSDDLDFDATDVIDLFKKMNNKGHICGSVTSEVWKPSASNFHTGAVQVWPAHHSSHSNGELHSPNT